jgi:fatty-acyl-CoA synthase
VIYDNGLLYVMDRESDAIKSGGEWIPSGVLEAHISEHPAVDIASVISRPDEKWGERPKAVVKASAEIGSEDLREFLLNKVEQGALARFWVPDEFSFVEDIPVTSAGKIDKVRLREQFKD